MRVWPLLLAGCVAGGAGAGGDEPGDTAQPADDADWLDLDAPVACDAPADGPSYTDVGRAWGLGGIHDPDGPHAGGAGAGVADFDLDGDLDVVLAYWNTAAQVFWREGDAFVPGPTLALDDGGKPQGIGLVDHDADGDWDVWVAGNDIRQAFYDDNGDGTFTRADAGVVPDQFRLAFDPPVAADWDLDGDVDLYLPALTPSGTAREDMLLRNDGTGVMADATDLLPAADGALTFQGLWLDSDGDLAPEAYGVNDQGPTAGGNVMFHNDAGVGFTNVVDDCYCATPVSGMSGDAADIDGDGTIDLFVGNSDQSNLYLNDGDGAFTDVAAAVGATECEVTGDPDMVWGSIVLDHDNDGDADILAVHGDLYSDLEPRDPLDLPDSLLDQQPDGTFVDVAADLGIDALDSGRSVVVDDLNGDGVLDLLVTVITDWPHLWMSTGCTDQNWLEVRVAGTPLNPHGVGARVEIEAGGRAQVQYLFPQSGLNAAHEPRAHFGLGDADTVDLLRVTLPTGEVHETRTPFAARRRVTARFP